MSGRRPAIVVHDLAQATAALRAAAAAGVPVTLWSAPGAAAYAGLGFLAAVFAKAGRRCRMPATTRSSTAPRMPSSPTRP